MDEFTAVNGPGQRVPTARRNLGAAMVEYIIMVAVIVTAITIGYPAALDAMSGVKTGHGWYVNMQKVVREP